MQTLVPCGPRYSFGDAPVSPATGCHRGGHHRRVVVLGRIRMRQLALVPEDERPGRGVVLRGVRQVVGGVGRDAAEAPRVLRHELGVGIDLDRDRACARPALVIFSPKSASAAAVRSEVGALERQPGGGGQVKLGVAPAAREPRGWANPLVVDAEPHAVDELERLGPQPAHLAGDVPAVGVEAAVLEADHAGALAGHVVTAVLQPLGDGELGCGNRRPRRGEQEREGDQCDELPAGHPVKASPGPRLSKPARDSRVNAPPHPSTFRLRAWMSRCSPESRPFGRAGFSSPRSSASR